MMIIGFRHVVVHDYFDLDIGRIWRIVEERLPGLEEQIRSILTELQLPGMTDSAG